MSSRCVLVLLVSLPVVPLAAQTPDVHECRPQSVALVLAGGGARGFAHIGVLRTLDSLGIHPNLVVGTSIGAIVGALYASGYTGAQVDSILRVLPVHEVIHPYSPRSPGVLAPLPAITVWENNGRGFHLQTGTARETDANSMLNAAMLRGNLIARGDFDRLPIPLRVVATDLATRSAVVLKSGDLARAVRASSAIPLVFTPVEVDGRVLFDGGMTENTPVRVARDLGAERIIVSLVPPGGIDASRLDDPVHVVWAMAQVLFVEDTSALRPDDIRVINPTDGHSPLDFSLKLRDEFIHGGAVAAARAFEKTCVQPEETRRHTTVPTFTNAVVIRGENSIERSAIRQALGLSPGSRLSEDSLRVRVREIGSSDAFRAVWLTPLGSDSVVDFDIRTVRAPRLAIALGAAYDNDHGGRVWNGFADRQLLGHSMEGAVVTDIGKYRREIRLTLLQQVGLTGRAFPLYASAVAVDEDVRLFEDSVEFAPASTRDVGLSAGVRPRFGGGWQADLAVEFRGWTSPTDSRSSGVAGLRIHFGRPATGRRARVSLDATMNSVYQRMAADLAFPFHTGTIEFLPRIRGGWGRDLPLQETFVFGGADGFAGFINGERRGSQELMGSLSIRRPLPGPLSLLGEIMSGVLRDGAPLLSHPNGDATGYFGNVVLGGRAGLEARASALQIRVLQGYNSERRRQLFVRIGTWF
jgi:predicted acylesterase/phospholipase RssA